MSAAGTLEEADAALEATLATLRRLEYRVGGHDRADLLAAKENISFALKVIRAEHAPELVE